jgi:hypothetical protein
VSMLTRTCLIFEPGTPNTNQYNPSTTIDVLDILLTRYLPSTVHLTSWTALSSDHLPALIDTVTHRFSTHQIALTSGALNWATFQTQLEAEIPFNPELHNYMANGTCSELLRRRSEDSSSFHSYVPPT